MSLFLLTEMNSRKQMRKRKEPTKEEEDKNGEKRSEKETLIPRISGIFPKIFAYTVGIYLKIID